MLLKNGILRNILQHLGIHLSVDVATLQSFDLATLQFDCLSVKFLISISYDPLALRRVINSKRGANNHTRCAVKGVGWLRTGRELAGREGNNIDAQMAAIN